MSRIRSIKPEFFLDEELAELSPLTRLLFVGLWTLADCEGRLEDRPKRIRAQLHPYDDGDTDAMLQALHDARFIKRYSVNGVRYLEIRSFKKHQRLSGKEADGESALPGPIESNFIDNNQINNIEATGKQRGSGQCPGREGNRKGREGNRKGRECIRASAERAHNVHPAASRLRDRRTNPRLGRAKRLRPTARPPRSVQGQGTRERLPLRRLAAGFPKRDPRRLGRAAKTDGGPWGWPRAWQGLHAGHQARGASRAQQRRFVAMARRRQRATCANRFGAQGAGSCNSLTKPRSACC